MVKSIIKTLKMQKKKNTFRADPFGSHRHDLNGSVALYYIMCSMKWEMILSCLFLLEISVANDLAWGYVNSYTYYYLALKRKNIYF